MENNKKPTSPEQDSWASRILKIIAGTTPAIIMGVYNHSNDAITKRYLGVEQDDLDKVRTSVMLF